MHLGHKIQEGSDPLPMNQNTTGSVEFQHLQSVALGRRGIDFAFSLKDLWPLSLQMSSHVLIIDWVAHWVC